LINGEKKEPEKKKKMEIFKMTTETDYKTMKKLLAVQKELESVTTDGKNPHFKSTFATLEAVTFLIKRVLNKHELILSQPVEENFVHTKVFDSASGSVLLSSKYPVITKDEHDPQKFAGGVTYARRISLLAIFAIPEVDDDGNNISNTKNGSSLPGRTSDHGSEAPVIKWGKYKGQTVDEALESDPDKFPQYIEWAISQGKGDPSKAKFTIEALEWKEYLQLKHGGMQGIPDGAGEMPY
jgi:hypothetical protein